MNKLLTALFVSVAFLANAATVYYVDPATGNDSNAGTSTLTAWAHMPGAIGFGPGNWHQLVNGDTLVVKGGSQNNYSTIVGSISGSTLWYSGSAAYDSILIESGHLFIPQWGTTRAIIDGQNTRTLGISFGSTSGAAVQGISLIGFEIRNIAPGNSGDSGSNGSSAIAAGGGNVEPSFFSVSQCYLHDVTGNGVDFGFGLEVSGSNFRIFYNTIGPNVGAKGIECLANGASITNNCIFATGEHCVALTGGKHIDVANNLIFGGGSVFAGQSPAYCIVLPSSDYCDVWNNLCFMTNTASGANRGGIGSYVRGAGGSSCQSNRIAFNTVYGINATASGSDHVGLSTQLGEYQGSGISTNTILQNNLVIFNRAANFLTGLIIAAPNTIYDDTEYNDFWYSASGDQVINYYNGANNNTTVAGFSAQANHTFSHNQQLSPGFSGGTFPTALDASFHPNQPYFQLSSLSPTSVTNTGNTIVGDSSHGYRHDAGKFTADILGNSRSQYSMGAYEYGAGGACVAPTISTQPTNQNIQVSQQIAQSVVAAGTLPFSYQWKFNGTAIAGATQSFYFLPNAQTANGGSYTVVVTNACGTVTSSTATITVTNPAVPLIGISMTNLNFGVIPTNTVSQLAFVVSNKGNGTLNGTASIGLPYSIASGAYSLGQNQSQTITVNYTPTAAEQDNGTIALTGGGGTNITVTGIAVTLQNPTNLTMGGATLIAGPAASFSLSSGFILQSVGSYLNPGNGGLAYLGFNLPNLVTNANLYATVEATNTLVNSSFWIALNAFPADPGNQWIITNITTGAQLLPVSWQGNSTNKIPQFPTNVWNLGGGFGYAVVAGRSSNTRLGTMQILQQTHSYVVPPRISVQPQSQNILLGTPVTFVVVATGTLPLSYQWNFNGAPISGANQTSYSINYPLQVDQGLYSCTLTNVGGSIVSFAASLNEYLPLGVIPSNSVIVIRTPGQ